MWLYLRRNYILRKGIKMVEMYRNKHDSKFVGLVCPETKLPLEVANQATLSVINERIKKQLRDGEGNIIQDTFETGLIQRDREVFYPIKGGIPLLLVSDGIHYNIERYGADTYNKEFGQIREQVVHQSKIYDNVAEIDLKHFDHVDWKQFAGLRPDSQCLSKTTNFPEPMNLWADAGLCQYYAYKFLTPSNQKCYLQLGGHGSHAIKFLLGGAKEAVIVDPSFKSLVYGRKLSKLFGVEKGFTPLRSCGEFIPYPDNYFDYIYAGGVLHHTDLGKTAKELYRVLKKGGKGAFVEPLRGNILYEIISKVAHVMHVRTVNELEAESIEHSLSYSEINDFINHFDNGNFREFRLFGMSVEILTKLLKLDISKVFGKINVVDEILLKHIALSRKFADIVTILVEKECNREV